MPLVDVSERAEKADLRSLLSVLAWTGEPGHIDRIISAYTTGPRLFGLERSGRFVAVIGVEVVREGEGVILHIAVEPAGQRSGIGRAL